jgi:hypothetical protein
VSPVKYELGLYIPEDYILHSHRRVNVKSYVAILFREHSVVGPYTKDCSREVRAGDKPYLTIVTAVL